MTLKTQTKTEQILTVMKILAWIAFVGFMVEGCAVLVSYIVSCINPEAAKNLYKGSNLYTLRQQNFWYYTNYVSFVVGLSAMKSYTWYLVIKSLSMIKLANPFKMKVALTLERISYVLFGTWVLGMISSGYVDWLGKATENFLNGHEVSGEFIFMAGIVFIISQIFKRGVELQSENELTV